MPQEYTIEAGLFAKLLSVASPLVEKDVRIPILSCIKVAFHKSGMSVSGTNIEQWITASTDDLDGPLEAVFATPARQLYALVQSFPKTSQINIEVGDGKIKLSCAKSKYTLACLPPEDWAIAPSQTSETKFLIDASELKAALSFVSPSISTEETRFYLNGVHFHKKPDGLLRLEATDGHRLSFYNIDVKTKDEDNDAIVPRAFVSWISSILGKVAVSEQIKIEIARNNISVAFKSGDIRVEASSKLIEWNFPYIDNIVPYSRDWSVSINLAQLVEHAKRVSIVSEDRRGQTVTHPLKIELSNGTALLSGINSQETVEVSGAGAEDKTVVNIPNLLALLGPFDCDEIAFSCDGLTRPIMLSDIGVDYAPTMKRLSILMPMVV